MFLKTPEHPFRVTQISADEATNVQKGRKGKKKKILSFLLWAVQLPQDYSDFLVLHCLVLQHLWVHLIYKHVLVEGKGLGITTEGKKNSEIPLTEVVSHGTSQAVRTIFLDVTF